MRVAYRYAKNRDEVEDIAQESLLRAWRKRSTLRDSSARNQWLAAIVRREAFRQGSKPRPVPIALEFEPGRNDARVTELVERADLRQAIEGLDESDRQLVRMRYDEDLTQAGIARRLGIPEGTVKVRLHRVRAKLRHSLALLELRSSHQAAAARRISSAAAPGPM